MVEHEDCRPGRPLRHHCLSWHSLSLGKGQSRSPARRISLRPDVPIEWLSRRGPSSGFFLQPADPFNESLAHTLEVADTGANPFEGSFGHARTNGGSFTNIDASSVFAASSALGPTPKSFPTALIVPLQLFPATNTFSRFTASFTSDFRRTNRVRFLFVQFCSLLIPVH